MTPSNPTPQRPELTFDGFGINGPDQYRTRIATFVDPHGLGDVARYGRLFAAAPEMLEALRDCAAGFAVAIASHGLNPDDNDTLRHARALLARLEGEQ